MHTLRKEISLATLLLFAATILLMPSPVLALTKTLERQLGDRAAAQVEATFKLSDDPYLDLYINSIAAELMDSMGEPPYPIKVRVIADTSINAFALPGGYIYFTSGIILAMTNENELAGVLAHEMAHIYGKHISRRFESSERLQIQAAAAMLAGVLISMAGSPNMGAAAMTFGSAATQTQALSYSRAHEEEADRLAMRAIKASRYSPWGLVTMMEKLGAGSNLPEDFPAYLLTHPVPDSRADYMAAELAGVAEMKAHPSPEFLLLQARVLTIDKRSWGPAEVVIRANENPGDYEAQIGAARVLSSIGKYPDAEKAIANAKRLAPERREHVYEDAMVRVSTGRSEGLVEELYAMWEGGEADEALKRTLALLAVEKGKPEIAVNVLNELSVSNSIWRKIDYYRGMAFGGVGRKAEGFAYLALYLRYINPRQSLDYASKAILSLPAGDLKERLEREIDGLKKDVKRMDEEARKG
ncbi:MAG: hypothetical protein C0609_07720 [Deltaproteobacteria bacterium]|nr:MAG: hypothetical protein C0609_07720 [Deltaproteobacteria bacterium]